MQNVVGREATDINACGTAGQTIRCDTCVFERFPGCLEQKALLRIEACRLPRRDAEKVGVEVGDGLADETGFARDSGAGRVLVEVAIARNAPALGRDLGQRVDTLGQKGPESIWIVRARGKAATDSYDGKWLAPPP